MNYHQQSGVTGPLVTESQVSRLQLKDGSHAR